jgi:diguanylate cyclase (GGDEF)-like protein
VNVAERTARVTISIGIAAYPKHGDTIDALVRAADDAQYVAKKSGKNRVAVADGGH